MPLMMIVGLPPKLISTNIREICSKIIKDTMVNTTHPNTFFSIVMDKKSTGKMIS